MQQIQEREESHGNATLPGPQVLGEKRDPEQLFEKPSVAPGEVAEKVYKVLVGIPLKGHTPPKSYHDRMLMWKNLGGQEAVDFYEKRNPRYVFSLGAVGEILVPFARETLADSALRMGCDYLFMVDDDMLTMPDLFYRLAAHDKDIVAALAFTRNPDHKPVIYESIEGYDQANQKRYSLMRPVINYPRNTLVQCDSVGFGAVLIKTEVFRKVEKPWFFGMAQTGEDTTICVKARKAGFSVWMDTATKLGHLGDPIIITEEYSDHWNKLTAEQKEQMYGKYTKYESENLG